MLRSFSAVALRMANLVLEKGEGHRFWREVAGGDLARDGFNRVAFHDPFGS